MNKILIIASEFPPGPGGIGQHAFSLALALSKENSVVVLANQDYAEDAEVFGFTSSLPKNLEVIKLAQRTGKTTSLKRMNQAVKIVRQLNPTIVFTSGRFPLWIGALLKLRFAKQKVYGFAHGTEVHLGSGYLGKITHKACTKHDGMIAVSHFTADILKHQGLKNIAILPNGLDDEFIQASKKSAENSESFQWQGQPKLLTVGNVTPRKGQHRIIKALPEILKKFPEAHYHVVGLPTTAEKLIKLAEQLGVAHAVTFHGKLATRKELYKAYQTADVFLMLSENQPNGDVEGFGIAILEANAFGVPAIGAKGCGIEDAISEESGILVDGNNAEEITKALETILAIKSRFGIGARKWAEQHNWAELIKSLVLSA